MIPHTVYVSGILSLLQCWTSQISGLLYPDDNSELMTIAKTSDQKSKDKFEMKGVWYSTGQAKKNPFCQPVENRVFFVCASVSVS